MSERVTHEAPPARARRWLPVHVLGPVLLLVLLVLLQVAAPREAAAATTAPAVSEAAATPSEFVPEWDGEDDATHLTFRLLARSLVRVVVLDAAGVERRVLVSGVRPAGPVDAWWDGRDAHGELLVEGSYRVRMAATVVEATDGPQEPGAGTSFTDGAQDVAVQLRSPSVAIRSVRLSRGSIGGAPALSQTRISFRMTAAGRVAAVVIDRTGLVRRNLFRGTIGAGPASLLWDGRDDAGAAMADGTYRLLVAASTGSMPSVTLRTPMRIDRRAPLVVLPATLHATSTRDRVTVGVVLNLTEPANVRLRVGMRTLDTRLAAGRHRITVRGSALGIGPLAVGRTLRIAAMATDATGNSTIDAASLVVAAAPGAPTSDGGGLSPGPSPSAMRLLWPVSGPLSSPFGMRQLPGEPRPRLHAGIDLSDPSGTPIHAADAGTVTFIGEQPGYGNIIELDHGRGLVTAYAHQSRFAAGLVAGDAVRRGQVIGYVGNTGHSTGNHLHFEVRRNGAPIDPIPQLMPR